MMWLSWQVMPLLMLFRLVKRCAVVEDNFIRLTKAIAPLLLHPVIVVVVFEAAPIKQFLKDLAKAVVVRTLFKSQCADLLHKRHKLEWNLLAQLLQRHLTLFGLDHLILLFLVCDFYALPG